MTNKILNSRQKQFLYILSNLIDEYNAEIIYTSKDDGVHLKVDGEEIFVGWFEKVLDQPSTDLKDFIERLELLETRRQLEVIDDKIDIRNSSVYNSFILEAYELSKTKEGGEYNRYYRQMLEKRSLKLTNVLPREPNYKLYPSGFPSKAHKAKHGIDSWPSFDTYVVWTI